MRKYKEVAFHVEKKNPKMERVFLRNTTSGRQSPQSQFVSYQEIGVSAQENMAHILVSTHANAFAQV